MYGYIIGSLIIVAIIIIIIVLSVKFYRPSENLGTFTIQQIQANPSCFTDNECGPNQFCYQGHCWGYWNYNPMPWNQCLTDSKLVPASILNGCAPIKNCSPYCKCKSTRGPGGAINDECYPVCGEACSCDEDCPAGCPQCYKGTCQPPFNPNFKRPKKC